MISILQECITILHPCQGETFIKPFSKKWVIHSVKNKTSLKTIFKLKYQKCYEKQSYKNTNGENYEFFKFLNTIWCFIQIKIIEQSFRILLQQKVQTYKQMLWEKIWHRFLEIVFHIFNISSSEWTLKTFIFISIEGH